MEDGYDEMNERLRKKYSDIYIDMITMVQKQDGRMPVFWLSPEEQPIQVICFRYSEVVDSKM